jgi:hypothetical protein
MFNFKKDTINRLFTRAAIAFYILNGLDSRPFSSISPSIFSSKYIFILFITNRSPITTSVFLFLDLETNQIINHRIYKGKNFYSKFSSFILNTLLESKLDTQKENLILIPRFYINKSLETRIKAIPHLRLEPYTIKTASCPPIMGEIKNMLRHNLPEDSKALAKWVTNFNYKFGGLLYKSKSILESNNLFSKISKRMYSTHTIKEQANKIKKVQEVNKWREFSMNIQTILDSTAIRNLLDQFWTQIADKKLKSKNRLILAIQLRVELGDGIIRSISTIDLAKSDDLNTLKDVYCELWSYKAGNYRHFNVKRVYLWYNFLPEGEFKNKISSKQLLERGPDSYTPKSLRSLIPLNMDFKSWGDFEFIEYQNLYKIQITDTNLIAHVSPNNDQNLVYIFCKKIGGLALIDSFTDKLLGDRDEFDSFKRQSDIRTLYYIKGCQVFLIETPSKWNFISQLKIPRDRNNEVIAPLNKVITMDLETRQFEERMEIVCLSVCYPNKTVKTFGIWEYKTAVEIIVAAFESILVKENDKSSVYFHNFSGFDSIFILRTLVNIDKLKTSPIFREGKLISLKLSYNKGGVPSGQKSKTSNTFAYSLMIYDSLLLLPSSLSKLAKAFKLEKQKGFFPLKFLDNTEIDWNYSGKVPNLKYFYTPHPLHKKEYAKYLEKYSEFVKDFESGESVTNWYLKEELIKYCEDDVIVLHHLILEFTDHIFKRYNLNIQKYPTLPSVAFAIYRSKFLKDSNLIPVSTGVIYSDLKQAYYGGFVDMYKPFARYVNSYDVNSLYPSSMLKYPMPVGTPQYFEGEPKYIENLFGFVFAKIEAPADLKTPILPVRIKKSGASTTIFPVGSWSGWYFTEELNNAKKYGYNFEILKGYTFKQSNLFSDYVQELYTIKLNSASGTPWYIISKLLLNSLYGRFGMSPYLETYKFVDESEFNELLKTDSVYITEFEEFGEKFGVSFRNLKTDQFSLPNVSVGIAAAISAWSRIEMTEYVMENSNNICYIDTDGIKITSELPSHQVGPKLGQMKWEGKFVESTFIAPKVYGGITTDSEMIIKVKGLKLPISYWELKKLLWLDPLEVSQSKWFRDFSSATIRILNQVYTLASNENKRELIRNSFGEIVDTAPYQMLNGSIIKSKRRVLYYLSAPLLEGLLSICDPKVIGLKLRLLSGLNLTHLLAPLPTLLQLPLIANIIYLPPPLPNVIYLPPPLPNIIYIYPEPIYMNLLQAPKSYLAIPEPKQLLKIAAPVSYLPLKAPIEEINIIYILPKVFYMESPLPSIIYLPRKRS